MDNRSIRDHISVCRVTLLMTVVAALLISPAIASKDYVSLNGGFYITYPDSWKQVEYTEVDYLLRQTGAGQGSFDYEVVLSQDLEGSFNQHAYVILTLDSLDLSSEQARDSVLKETAEVLSESHRRVGIQDNLAAVEESDVVLDEGADIVVARTSLESETQPVRQHLYVMRAYPGGTAHFLFYCADSIYADMVGTFQGIVKSFSTENVTAHLPKEEVRLADADRIQGDDSGGLSATAYGGIVVGGAILLIVLLLAIRRKASSG